MRGRDRRPLPRPAPRPRGRRLSRTALLRRAAVAAALVAAALTSLTCRPPRPANLVLITVDTLRADHLGSGGAGPDASPALDRLAAEGVVFSDASTVLPRTTQAVASLLTGVAPVRHGSLEIGQAVDPAVTTLAERLAAAGYATVGISANPVAGPAQGLDRGFRAFVERSELGRRHDLSRPLDGPVPAGLGPAEAVTREAMAALDATGDRPFFLWALYMDPHWDYNPPAPYNQVVDWAGYGLDRVWHSGAKSRPRLFFNLDGRAAAARADAAALYAAEVRYSDHWIGRLLDHLRQRADWARTLVVVTSDHGESLGEHGYYYQHGDFVDQACLHVPLIFRLPGDVAAGRRVATPVSLLDVVPTVLAALGLATPAEADLDGRDLSPLWQEGSGADLAGRILLAESGSIAYPESPLRLLGGRGDERFIRRPPWVLVEDRAGPRLYDAAADPLLLDDVAARQPAVAARLAEELAVVPLYADRWRSARQGSLKALRIPTPDGVSWRLYDLASDPGEEHDLVAGGAVVPAPLRAALDGAAAAAAAVPARVGASVEEQLRALGYLDD